MCLICLYHILLYVLENLTIHMAQNSLGIAASIFSRWTSGCGTWGQGFRGDSGGAGLMVGTLIILWLFKA